MDEQQSINKKIANQIPVIVQKSVQEQPKKPKRKGFLGIFGNSYAKWPGRSLLKVIHHSCRKWPVCREPGILSRMQAGAVFNPYSLHLSIRWKEEYRWVNYEWNTRVSFERILQAAHVRSKFFWAMVYRRIKPLLRKKLYEIEKIREIHIKISRFIVTFAYEEFFEGYATRRRIMQQITN